MGYGPRLPPLYHLSDTYGGETSESFPPRYFRVPPVTYQAAKTLESPRIPQQDIHIGAAGGYGESVWRPGQTRHAI